MCRTLWLLILSTAAAGFAVGILDTATNVQLIGIHGKKASIHGKHLHLLISMHYLGAKNNFLISTTVIVIKTAELRHFEKNDVTRLTCCLTERYLQSRTKLLKHFTIPCPPTMLFWQMGSETRVQTTLRGESKPRKLQICIIMYCSKELSQTVA